MRIAIVWTCLLLVAGCGGTVESRGTGGAGGHTTTGSQGSSGGAGSVTSTGSTGGSPGGCQPACGLGLVCCGSACINTDNDILHCGDCKTTCGGTHPFCAGGSCGTPPCEGQTCPGSGFCCGSMCCDTGMLCCDIPGPGPTMGPTCTAPENGTCPVGCPACQ